MDYQVFLVRSQGQSGSIRAGRGALRLFRIQDHGISVLPLSTPNAAPLEYRFEHISKVLPSDDDDTELKIEILDTSKSGFGYETVRYWCEARASLLTALLNRIEDMNGIGMCQLPTIRLVQCIGVPSSLNYVVREVLFLLLALSNCSWQSCVDLR